MNRRHDHDLRSAINTIERLHLDPPSKNRTLEIALLELMQLSESRYGFCLKHNAERDDHSGAWLCHTCYQMQEGQTLKIEDISLDSVVIPEAYLTKLRAGLPVNSAEMPEKLIINTDVLSQGEHPAHCILIPFRDAKKVHGIIVLCCQSADYYSKLSARVPRFITAVNCVLRISEKPSNQTPSLPLGNHIPSMVQNFIDMVFNAVLVMDAKGNILVCNHPALEMFEHNKTDMINQHIGHYISIRLPKPLNMSKSDGSPIVHTGFFRNISLTSSSKKKKHANMHTFQLNNQGQIFTGVVLEDISEKVEFSESYKDMINRFQVLTNVAPIAILELNSKWECIYTNKTWTDYTQLNTDQSERMGWLQAIHPEDAMETFNNLQNSMSATGKFNRDIRLITPDGYVTWVQVNARSLYSSSGVPNGFLITLNDVSEHHKTHLKLKEIAQTDQLTGLTNRSFFIDRLEQALVSCDRHGLIALMLLDLDNFKYINDTLGHDAGDLLIQQVAKRVKAETRSADSIARIGGDEFTVLLTHITNTNIINSIADKLIKTLSDPFEIKGRSLYISCSIGIAVTETSATASQQLQKQADVALYKAKNSGKNQYKFYTPELDEYSNLYILIKESLKNRQRCDFSLNYQPQIDARSGELIGIEALSRWSTPDTGIVSPDLFIGMIEESGLISDFNEWLLDEAFSQIKQWQSRIPNKLSKVSINLSAKQFRDNLLAEYLYQKVKSYDINPSNIVFEVTETALIGDTEIALKTLNKMRDIGFTLALDDFGTGYSSLSYLKDMPFDILKIDQSFIRNILLDEQNIKIASAIIDLANALNMDIIAEGVEEQEVSEWLVEHNCYVQQGYYFSKPVQAKQLENLLINNT